MFSTIMGKESFDKANAGPEVRANFSAHDIGQELVAQAEAQVGNFICHCYLDGIFFFNQEGIDCFLVNIGAATQYNHGIIGGYLWNIFIPDMYYMKLQVMPGSSIDQECPWAFPGVMLKNENVRCHDQQPIYFNLVLNKHQYTAIW
jgi:hypothetical protein